METFHSISLQETKTLKKIKEINHESTEVTETQKENEKDWTAKAAKRQKLIKELGHGLTRFLVRHSPDKKTRTKR